MTRLTVTNTNISNSLTVFSRLTVNNATIAMTPEGLSVGSNVSVNSSQVTVGSTFINSSTISSPSLILGGTPWGLYKGIVDYQVFTANGTWTNPSSNTTLALNGNEQVLIMMWGGGGGAAANNTASRAGSGGACVIGTCTVSDLASTVSVTVGLGGVGKKNTTVAVQTPNPGTDTIFGPVTAYGGGSGDSGGGGGTLSAGTTSTTGGPLGGVVSTYGGGDNGGGTTAGGTSIFGGGGGTRNSGSAGGNSVYGGGGGSGGGAGGASVFGGNGGNNTLGSVNGVAPGGGAGALASIAGAAGNGARGEVRVWVIK